MNNKKQIGQRIKAIRVNRNETLEEFANKIRLETKSKIKTTKSNVSKWEKGNNVPNDITLNAIAKLGDVSVEYLLNGSTSISNAYASFILDEKMSESLSSLTKSLSSMISNDELKKSTSKITLPLLTRDINIKQNKDNETLTKKLQIINDYFSKFSNEEIKINALELDFLVESILTINDIRKENIPDEQQFIIYSTFIDAIKTTRNNIKSND